MSTPAGDSQEEVQVDDSTDEDTTPHKPEDKFLSTARADEVLEIWRTKFAEGILSLSHFQDHWRVTVPRIYSPNPNRSCLEWTFDENLGVRLLIQPLEQFIWGTKDGEQPVITRRPTLCGRVFKQGEPAYSCRECGMDNTCVLCVECFKVSAHRHHKYKMGQSGGGGCCDCGDPEAWKKDPFCELHTAPDSKSSEAEGIKNDVIERMKIVANYVLSYCFRLLTLDHAPDLPCELRLKDAERDPLQILDHPDIYCTVLYNDESHTFEQVIMTLTRIMKCENRDAVELVTLVDREGRALVKCGSFQVCDKLKNDIEARIAMSERYTLQHGSTLKVLVMHAHVAAHQMYAMKLLQWLQNFVNHEISLRVAVSAVILGEDKPMYTMFSGHGIANGVMQNDCNMWKAARTAWHRLLLATTLMDYESKKALSILFTKNYASVMKDFIHDDHDHSFSVSSLSVQLYTTPTLAHHLVATHDAFYVVLNTFVSECVRRCNRQGRLEFRRDHTIPAFKRAQFVLYDVKYLLSAIPTQWTDELRMGFLHGLQLLLNLLAMMQGMDSIVRQVGQHMEYEPEWESAFNLHVKLAHSITMAMEWCSSDRTLTVKAYRMALRKLTDVEKFTEPYVRVQGATSQIWHDMAVIGYDVASQPVSIHQPLSRFVAGLHLLLGKHGFTYHSKEFEFPDRPKPQPEQLMEPVLRTAVMMAQVHAGMWRRNGFALLNQLYFYHNVKCRSEMLDKDIVMLQIGVSLIESNAFMVHVLNKFNLLDWVRPEFESKVTDEDNIRHITNLVEEFLGLLISIVGSRYVPGVSEATQDERIKKEIIQMLCIKPMAHSELSRCLPEDQLHETGMEAVIDDVADFIKKGPGNVRGKYVLKPQYYDEYDTFYYHYTREELSKSEERQRNRRKTDGLPECCPPPPLPKLTGEFKLLANLLQCETSLCIIKTIFDRALNLRTRCFSETQVHKALHLMGYALRDEECGHYEFVTYSEAAHRTGIHKVLNQLVNSPRVEAHRPLMKWVLNKMRQLLGDKADDIPGVESMEVDQDEAAPNPDDVEKQRRAKLAAESRQKLMAQMLAAQNNFISRNATLFEETATFESNVEEMPEVMEMEQTPKKALGVWGGGAVDQSNVCIMCQDTDENSPLVLVAFVQYSTVLYRGQRPQEYPAWEYSWLSNNVGPAPHVSSCGHTLHVDCWKKYVENIVDKESRRPYRMRQPAAFDVEKKEYLCPLCERLCNTALALLPSPPSIPGDPPPLTEEQFDESLDIVLNHKICIKTIRKSKESCEPLHCIATVTDNDNKMDTADKADKEEKDKEKDKDEPPVYMISHTREMLPEAFLNYFPVRTMEHPSQIADLVKDFSAILPKKCFSQPGSFSSLAALCRSTSYSIMAVNSVLAAEKRPLIGELPARHKAALNALIRLVAIIPSVWPKARELAHHAVVAMRQLEETSPTTYLPFSLLVPLVITFPGLFSAHADVVRPTILTKQITLRVFRAMLVRTIISFQMKDIVKPMEEDSTESRTNTEDLSTFLNDIEKLRKETIEPGTDPLLIWEYVKNQSRHFLRCCCLFFHFLSDVEPPAELCRVDGDSFEVMCSYLDLPTTYKDLLGKPEVMKKAIIWSKLSVEYFSGDIKADILIEPSEPPKLIDLPLDYSELMNVVSEFTCPNSEREDCKYPTMCLVCGEILCSQSYCCQTEVAINSDIKGLVGSVVAHAVRCGGCAGIFLRVRDCELLLLTAPSKGSMSAAPYLDSYGETDQGLRRGNPLRLCPERFEIVRRLWLNHAIHEKIARALDNNVLVTTQWQNM